MNSAKARSGLTGIAGGYLLYIAYELFRDRGDPNTTMTPVARVLFIILFVLCGGALIVYAWRLWKQSLKEEEEKQRTDDGDGLK